MIQNSAIKIAVIAENVILQEYIVQLLLGEDYQVIAFSVATEALEKLPREEVDLIISEFNTPHINGLELCKYLRKNLAYNFTPILFLIPDTESLTPAKLTFVGADDYIKSSSIKDELFLKVKLNLNRIDRHRDINSISRLPGLTYFLKDLEKRIDLKESFAVGYLRINSLDAFNYAYGFEKGSQVIKYTASLVRASLYAHGNATDLLSHFQSNDFVFSCVIDNVSRVDTIINSIIEAFDKNIPFFYSAQDRQNRFVLYKTRRLEIIKAPLASLRIGVLLNEYFPVFRPDRVLQLAAEIASDPRLNCDESSYIIEEKKNFPAETF